ncbi:hypothetical protein BDP27DRAFT_1334620 [Rhodocollybia butyracea]|uniref:Uncharacterized protein n=1 Tax=Rhodocollybia butyracea TaxID=206335 RepID=A0A9P5PEF1_9AGAR|nr:hypothetical protein BDP27DRAFT_1334620 [Rhodocollybia butyracea]
MRFAFAFVSLFAATIGSTYATSCDFAFNGMTGTGLGVLYSCASVDFVVFSDVCNGAVANSVGPWCCSGEFFPAEDGEPSAVGGCFEA